MKVRKIVLLAADLILLAVCIVQGILSVKDNAKTFEVTETPDEILIDRADGSFAITKTDDNWYIGEQKFPANNGSVEVMIDAASSIRTLDKMGKASNDAVAGRYDLSADKKITVTLKKEGKILRTIGVGKESSTGTQGYVTIDDGDDVYLTASNLKNSFNKTVDDLRNKTVLQLDKNSITAVTMIDDEGNTWTLSRSGSGESLSWSISGVEIDVDPSAATEWFNSLATLNAAKWYGSTNIYGGEKAESVRITVGSKTVSLDLYYIEAETEEDRDVYYAKCSESPYFFEVPSYSVAKFQKTPEDLER